MAVVAGGVAISTGGADVGLLETLDVLGVVGSTTGFGTLRGVAGAVGSSGAATLSGAGGACIGCGCTGLAGSIG